MIPLTELFEPEAGRTWSEPEFGLNVHDVLAHIYETEQRFIRRDKRESVLVKAERGNALTEAVFGVYPTSADVCYIPKAYTAVYEPENVSAQSRHLAAGVPEGRRNSAACHPLRSRHAALLVS